MADPLQFNTPFNFKNFLASKGTSGLESIFKYVPDRMKLSILKSMYKMHPTQALNFMREQLQLPDAFTDTYGTSRSKLESWMARKLVTEGPISNTAHIPYDHTKRLRLQLADPNLDSKTRKLIESFLKMHTTDAGKYEMALLNQLEKKGASIVTNVIDDVELGKARVIDHTIPEGDVIDFKTRKIINPKINYPYPQYIPPWQREVHKPIPPGQKMTRVPPVPKGIPWSNIGMRLLNNPLTRFVGGAGNVALAGQALLDIGTGSEHTGNMMRNFNEMMGVPYKDDGTVWTNTQDYENFMNPPSPAVGQPGGPPVERFNRGGIVSLML